MADMFALTAIGRDRPGIVAGLTEILFKLGCNLEETSMTRLRNDFAMILLISAPDRITEEVLRRELKPVSQKLGLTMELRTLNDDEIAVADSAVESNYIVTITGIDKPGIVYRITDLFARTNINISELETQIGDKDGQPLYAMFLEIYLPDDMDIDALSGHISRLGTELDVDVSIEPILSCEEF